MLKAIKLEISHDLSLEKLAAFEFFGFVIVCLYVCLFIGEQKKAKFEG